MADARRRGQQCGRILFGADPMSGRVPDPMSEPERVIPLPTPRDMERDAVNDYNTPFRVEECGAITSWLRRAVFAEAAAAKLAEALQPLANFEPYFRPER